MDWRFNMCGRRDNYEFVWFWKCHNFCNRLPCQDKDASRFNHPLEFIRVCIIATCYVWNELLKISISSFVCVCRIQQRRKENRQASGSSIAIVQVIIKVKNQSPQKDIFLQKILQNLRTIGTPQRKHSEDVRFIFHLAQLKKDRSMQCKR